MLTPELIAQERRHDRISAIATTIIMIIFMLLTLVWTAYRQRVPPPGEKDYEVLGAIDFGDYKNGSRRVNNFEKAVKDPAPQPKQESAKPQEAQVAEQTPTPTPPVVTKAPSPVVQPDPPVVKKPDPKPTPPKTVTPPKEEETKPDPKNNNNNNSSSKEETELDFNLDNSQSGSNHGDSDDGIGNSGTPNVKVLDPDGLYSFGTGSGGGLQGRSPLSLSQPKYTVQEEGQLKFEFFIEPNGSVSYVKLVGVTNKPGLKQAGIDAIKRWKFSKAPGSQRQKVQVTIKFKLKG